MTLIPEFPFPMSTPRASLILHKTHFVQLALACLLFILFIVRLILRTQGVGIDYSNPTAGGGAASGWGTGVAAKSIIFIGYQVLTETHPKFKRWASLKTNMVFNILEVAFWWALVGITAGSLGSCVAPMCGLNAVILVLCLVLALAGLPVAYTSIVLFQQFRRSGLDPAQVDPRTASAETSSAELPMFKSYSPKK